MFTPAPHHGQLGQAAVELVAVMPLLALLLSLGWQLAYTGHCWWRTGEAARAAARAASVPPGRGLSDRRRRAAAAASRSLPAALRRGHRLALGRESVTVSTRVPIAGPLSLIVPALGGPVVSVRAGGLQ